MQKLAVIVALSGLAVGSAGGMYVLNRASSDTAMTADIERDLQLAASAPPKRTAVVSAIEQGRPGAPSGQARGQRMAVPTTKRAPKATPSPSVMEAPQDVSAEVPEAVPAPVRSEPVAVAASASDDAPPDNSYPTPVEGPSAGTGSGSQRGSGDVGSGGGGMRTGAVIGAIAGAIIRGASAGRDHCEPGGGRRRGGVGGGTLGTIGGVLIRR